MIFEVDINEIRPRTWRVEAETAFEAREKAMWGHGTDISKMDYTEGEVVDIRKVDDA